MKVAFTTLFIFRSFCVSAVTRKRPVTLITFDVDGTLVQGSSQAAQVSAHARSFGNAVGKVFGGIDNWEESVPSPPSIIPSDRYHGSTDGIIALNLAYYGFKVEAKDSHHKLQQVFQEMYKYVAALPDEEVARGIDVLPGVIDQLNELATNPIYQNGNMLVGLVTGNVEGIARKKMRAVGILSTKVFSKKADDQTWEGENADSFLGGFGSCYCSGIIDDTSRLHIDRGEQILIAVRRARSCLADDQEIVRVVHVGDAPSDVLAARYVADEGRHKLVDGGSIEVGMIAVATGKFSVEELRCLVGPAADYWDPVVLERGLADPDFIKHCKILL